MVVFYAKRREGATMKKRFAIVAACCAFALMLGLVGCGGSSGSAAASASGSASGSASAAESTASSAEASASASAAAVEVDVKPEYLAPNGGITLNAVLDLTGPEVETLLQQQGYEWVKGGFTGYKNAATEDSFTVRSTEGDIVKQDGYASATGKGDLAEGYVRIVTHAYPIETTADLETIRDGMLAGYTVEDSWIAGGGAYFYSVVKDSAGARSIIVVIAENANEAWVEFETDAYLLATGDGDGVDGVIATWRS